MRTAIYRLSPAQLRPEIGEVRRRDKEIIEIGECASLACVIDRLQTFHRSLGEDSQAELRVAGNDYFGWRLTITYLRDMMPEESELDARYTAHSGSEGP